MTVGRRDHRAGPHLLLLPRGPRHRRRHPPEDSGPAGVLEVPHLQRAMLQIGRGGYKHHFAMSTGHVADRCIAALRQHEGYQVTDLRGWDRAGA